MNHNYRYLSKKKKLISFLLLLISFLVILSGVWGSIIYSYHNDFGGGKFTGVIAIIVIIVGVIWNINERYIKSKCNWDSVSINDKELASTRYGIIPIKSIKRIRINDISKVYNFYMVTGSGKFKFSCLSFLGGEGGSEYSCDKEALKSIAEKLLQFANSPEYKISVGKESSSGILFALSCLTMIMLIPGFIYAPQRMIFVAPFVIPLFITLWLKRKNENRK